MIAMVSICMCFVFCVRVCVIVWREYRVCLFNPFRFFAWDIAPRHWLYSFLASRGSYNCQTSSSTSRTVDATKRSGMRHDDDNVLFRLFLEANVLSHRITKPHIDTHRYTFCGSARLMPLNMLIVRSCKWFFRPEQCRKFHGPEMDTNHVRTTLSTRLATQFGSLNPIWPHNVHINLSYAATMRSLTNIPQHSSQHRWSTIMSTGCRGFNAAAAAHCADW